MTIGEYEQATTGVEAGKANLFFVDKNIELHAIHGDAGRAQGFRDFRQTGETVQSREPVAADVPMVDDLDEPEQIRTLDERSKQGLANRQAIGRSVEHTCHPRRAIEEHQSILTPQAQVQCRVARFARGRSTAHRQITRGDAVGNSLH